MRLLGCVFVLTIAACVVGCSSNSEAPSARERTVGPIEVEIAPVSRKGLTATLELVGNFLPSRRTVIVAEVDGVIEKIPEPTDKPTVVEFAGIRESLPLDIGAEVRKGDLLVKLDASDYELGLKEAEARWEKEKKSLQNLLAWKRPEETRLAQALYDKASANQKHAQLEFDRLKPLRTSRTVSQSEYDEKEAHFLAAVATLAHAKASLDIAQAGPTPQELAVATAEVDAVEAEVKHAQWKVDKTFIVAPYAAVVTERYVDVGDRVTALPRVEIMEIMDIRFLVAEAGVPQRHFGRFKLLDRATVRVQGDKQAIPGLIVRINKKIDPGSRTFRIRVAVENTARRFQVGQFVGVLLDVATAENALTVPRPAVTYSGGQPSVFLYADGKVTRTPVDLGIATDDAVEILSGLSENDQVVVDDPAVLTDNMSVQVRSSATVARISRSP